MTTTMHDPRRAQLDRRLTEALDQLLDNLVDPRDAWYDDDGTRWMQVAAAGEASGSARPAALTEPELIDVRQQCRALAATNEFAINGHENRVSYIVGAGHTYRVTGKKHLPASSDVLRAAQDVLDHFLFENHWHRRQQELVLRMDRDGEAFLRFFAAADGTLRVRFVEPGQIATPAAHSTDPHSSFGILTDRDDVETVHGYYVDGQWVDAAEIQHRKENVDQNVKRGLPLYYPVRKNLRRAEKLLRNMSIVAEIQSAIALVRRHRGPRSAVQQFIRQQSETSAAQSGAASHGPTQRFVPGSILDVHGDVEYDFPAAALDAGSFVSVLQAELRAIAARLVMPEFMFTSDASNANYSSTMVAEGPAVRMFQRLQQRLIEMDLQVMWRVLEHAARGGQLRNDELAGVEIQITPPSLTTRDRRGETEARAVLHRDGILSAQSWSQLEGLDFDQEQTNIDVHRARINQRSVEDKISGKFVS